MNISGIRPYSGFYDYNSIQGTGAVSTASIDSSQIEQADKPQEETAAFAQRDTSAQTFGSADYAKQYQSEASYEMKGVDSDIRDLDVTKAISDLQKDQVLQQYQFFVGESQGQNSIGELTGGGNQMVRATENFNF